MAGKSGERDNFGSGHLSPLSGAHASPGMRGVLVGDRSREESCRGAIEAHPPTQWSSQWSLAHPPARSQPQASESRSIHYRRTSNQLSSSYHWPNTWTTTIVSSNAQLETSSLSNGQVWIQPKKRFVGVTFHGHHFDISVNLLTG